MSVHEIQKASAFALEWDYRTDQARQACEKAFALLGPDHEEGTVEIFGFQHPIEVTSTDLKPLSSYNVIVYRGSSLSSIPIEDMDEEAFASVSKAVLSSHLGNADRFLHSRIDDLAPEGLLSKGVIYRTVLHNMMIFTPRDLPALGQISKKPQRACEGNEIDPLYPKVSALVVPPAASNHARARRLHNLQYATELAKGLLGMPDLEINVPKLIHPPIGETTS